MDRRTLIGGGSAAAALVSTRSRSARAAAVDVVVFGDSYSQVPRAGFPNWVTQLQTTHSIGRSDNFAKSGATAAKIGTNHLARQLRLWRQAGRPVGDWVIVFIGTNDILQTNSLTASKSAINAVVTELRAAGARLLLIEPLNVGKTPRFAGDQDSAAVTKKTKEWDRFLRSRACRWSGCTTCSRRCCRTPRYSTTICISPREVMASSRTLCGRTSPLRSQPCMTATNRTCHNVSYPI